MISQKDKSATQILEELIYYRAEKLPDVTLTNFPEALTDLLNEKNNRIKELELSQTEILTKLISLSGGVTI